MKTSYRKLKPKIISYKFYIYYTSERFSKTVLSELSKVVIENNSKGLDRLLGICRETHNIHAPHKIKHKRDNYFSFMNKMLSKKLIKKNKIEKYVPEE